MTLTHKRLRELLHYDPDTGVFTWRVARGSAKAGDRPNTKIRKGYMRVKVGGRNYLAHRLAWLYVTGARPNRQIDHKDRNTGNNRFDNLRDATSEQNKANSTLMRTNKSGVSGVTWHTTNKRWVAHIRVGGTKKHLGAFTEFAQACAARALAERQHNPEWRPL